MDLSYHRRLSIAPMLAMTDRHERFFLRIISRNILLYSEMVTTKALIHADPERFLAYNPEEHPVALQIGGSDPGELVYSAKLAEKYGYDEVNLNLGCPSDKVQVAKFGACLMAEPDLVAEGYRKMKEAVDIPVTVKTRIGIDDQDSYDELKKFIQVLVEAGCKTFIIHARKAWLNGLNPKQNREIPPLKYDFVYQIKQDFPQLHISINGGIHSLEQVKHQLEQVDGVMIGREAYHNPYFMAEADRLIFNENQSIKSREEILEEFILYIESHLKEGEKIYHFTRHIIGLFHGMAGSRQWRRIISENAHKKDAGIDMLRKAYDAMASTW